MRETSENIYEIHLDEKALIDYIKCLLGVPSKYTYMTIDGKVVMRLKANHFNVKRAIYEWLNLTERKEDFMRLGK